MKKYYLAGQQNKKINLSLLSTYPPLRPALNSLRNVLQPAITDKFGDIATFSTACIFTNSELPLTFNLFTEEAHELSICYQYQQKYNNADFSYDCSFETSADEDEFYKGDLNNEG